MAYNEYTNLINRTVSDRGISNLNYKQVGSLISLEDIKSTWLFGLTGIMDGQGQVMGDPQIISCRDLAISMLEHDLDLAFQPRHEIEMKDYDANAYMDWGFLQLNRIPVISIVRFRAVYLADTKLVTLPDNSQVEEIYETALEIPPAWLRIDLDTGVVRLIPTNKFPARLQVDSVGSFFPELFRRHSMVPSLWQISYYWGFKDGAVPMIINLAIGLLTSILVMNTVGDIFPLGSGIASASIGLDGLSQSIQTTASAENTTLSARIKNYQALLYGDKTHGVTGIIETLRNYYKGATINII